MFSGALSPVARGFARVASPMFESKLPPSFAPTSFPSAAQPSLVPPPVSSAVFPSATASKIKPQPQKKQGPPAKPLASALANWDSTSAS